MANNKNKQELENLNDLIATFEAKYTSVLKKIHKTEKQNAHELSELKLEIGKKVGKMLAKGEIKAKEDAFKYSQALMEEGFKEKLQREIGILKEISKESKKERDQQHNILKKEKQILEFSNKGQEKEANLLKKEVALEKKKLERKDKLDRIQESGLDYQLGDNLSTIFDPLKEEIALGNSAKRSVDKALLNSIKNMGKAIENSLNVINQTISEYAKYQTSINTRLQGRTTFGELVDKLDTVAFSPLMSAKDLYNNLSNLVGQGIVTNVEQRAFFATIKDGIATTFDASNESLNRIIRIQRNDSTAARLGMEGYLTKFLNVYVENTEYLQSTFDTVASSLLEASAVLGNISGVGASLEFEYVVQKWLGTLTGIGLSDSTAQDIAKTIGGLGAGDVDSLNSDIGRLLTMSAGRIGQNIGDILNTGLDATTTNKLLTSMVMYLKTIAGEGTNVTKAELAKVFGVSISDLVAVAKMEQEDIKTITDDLLSYTGMYSELRNQFNQLPSRMGISNILENLFSNLTYQTGMSIAGNPASYAMWKITDLIQGVTGGINIPFITALGTGVDLNTTVENLMKLSLVGVNMLGNIGEIINGVNSIGKGSVLLDKLKINAGDGAFTTFGEGLKSRGLMGLSTSQTAYIGQESSDAYYESTINQQRAKAQGKLNEEIKNQETVNPILKYLHTDVDLKTNMSVISTAANTVSTASPVVAYLASLEFATGFKSIVEDIGVIKDRMPTGNNTNSPEGWNQNNRTV